MLIFFRIVSYIMTDFYHGCTGGCFDSPVHWSDIYGWQYAYHNDPSEWSDNVDTQFFNRITTVRERSDEYLVTPKIAVRKNTNIHCFSFLFGILHKFSF